MILVAAGLVALTGCSPEETVQVETVTHPDREPIRLRIALWHRPDIIWVVKVSGPAALVTDLVPSFDAFVRSARFDEKGETPIQFAEPKEWKKDPPGGRLRYAGYRIDTKSKQLEVTVSRFGADGFSLITNVHRWQKQVNAPLTESIADLKPPLVTDEKLGDLLVTWVDLSGLGVHTVSKQIEAQAANKQRMFPPIPMKKPAAGGNVPFKYVVPDGWKPKPPGQFAVEAYEVSDGNNRADVTLTPAGGEVADNVNRWRDQIGLPPLPDEEARRSTVELPIQGIKNHYVDIANPRGPAAKNRTLGVIIPGEDAIWFVKMIGPIDWVGQNKAAFETFVKSFKRAAR
jgi:hypothetical protein